MYRTICIVTVKLVKIKKIQIKIKKQIDASINAMKSTTVSMSLKRAFAESNYCSSIIYL